MNLPSQSGQLSGGELFVVVDGGRKTRALSPLHMASAWF